MNIDLREVASFRVLDRVEYSSQWALPFDRLCFDGVGFTLILSCPFPKGTGDPYTVRAPIAIDSVRVNLCAIGSVLST